MATTLPSADPFLQLFQSEKQAIWDAHQHLPEQDRDRLWLRRKSQLASLLATDQAQHAQAAHTPRTVSYAGPLPPSTFAYHFDLPMAMNRSEDLSVHSAPLPPNSYSASPTSTARPARFPSTDFAAHYRLPGTQSHSVEPPTSYTLGRSPVLPHPSAPEVEFDPSDYIATFGPSTLSPHDASLAYQQDAHLSPHAFTGGWSFNDGAPSPSTSVGELTVGSTLASPSDSMSRQQSCASARLASPLDMARVHSNFSHISESCFRDEFSASSTPSIGKPSRGSIDGVSPYPVIFNSGDAFSTSQFPISVTSAPPAPCSQFSLSGGGVEHMAGSSASSTQGASSATAVSPARSSRRHLEHLAQGARPIAPKASDCSAPAADMSSRPSEHQMIRISSENGSTKNVAAISKAPYIRPVHPKIMCQRCNDHPEGFRGEHELRRHTERVHSEIRKVWVTVDASENGKFLANCKACRNGKKYGAYYNAAAHLRRAHFNPRKRGRKGKNEERRGGKGGGDHPAMDYLKQHWMREVEEYVPENASKRGRPAAVHADPEDDMEASPAQDMPLDVDFAVYNTAPVMSYPVASMPVPLSSMQPSHATTMANLDTSLNSTAPFHPTAPTDYNMLDAYAPGPSMSTANMAAANPAPMYSYHHQQQPPQQQQQHHQSPNQHQQFDPTLAFTGVGAPHYTYYVQP